MKPLESEDYELSVKCRQLIDESHEFTSQNITASVLYRLISNGLIKSTDLKSVIDFGAGYGISTALLKSLGAEVTAIEIDDKKREILKAGYNIADLEEIKDHSQSLFIAFNFELIGIDFLQLLNHVHRILIPDRKFICTFDFMLRGDDYMDKLKTKEISYTFLPLDSEESSNKIVAYPATLLIDAINLPH